MNQLRNNQIKAIHESLSNDFDSGIHYHATGSGKSWIAMHIILQFNEKYPKSNIIWICEKKSILIEQFNIKNLRERDFGEIFHKFNILNYSNYKLSSWYNSVNSSIFWNKPVLLIINRAFLTSNENYTKIKIPFHLIIHDECHTIVNKTTRQFYDYLLDENNNTNIKVKCIGFSATPNQSYDPFKKIITSYSIYDAFIDNVIVPPKIKWFSCDDIIDYNEIIYLIKKQIDDSKLIYKKIIIWCGMIDLCINMASLYSRYFEDYLICLDTSKNIDGYSNYNDFEKIEKQAILFCAAKHREGSDIKNLDCCIFLDKVENRCPKVFLQCIGRVLRMDKSKLKTFGLVIDVRAKSSLNICNHMNEYLNLPFDVFPWKYNYEINIHNTKLIRINQLDMIKHDKKNIENIEKFSNSIQDLQKLFIRKINE